MKKFLAVVLMGVCGVCWADQAYLSRVEFVRTVTGKDAAKCYYRLGGRETYILVPAKDGIAHAGLCPQTIEVE